YKVYHNGNLILPNASTSFVQTDLGPDDLSALSVSGVDSSGQEGSQSSPAFAYTLARPPVLTRIVEPFSSAVGIAWSTSTNSGYTSYSISYSTNAAFIPEVSTGNIYASSYVVTGLAESTTYYLR